jgi:hypothetical protein
LTKKLGVFLGALAEKSPDLKAVIDAWPTLPDALRRAIAAMVRCAALGGA